jgi:DUF971 family protein
MNTIRPTSITLNKLEAVLHITWNNGEQSEYPLSHLREACPCVECRGGHAFMGEKFDPEHILKLTPKRSYQCQAIAQVGNYALQPTWDDGHHTGIYTWEYLYKIRVPKTSHNP